MNLFIYNKQNYINSSFLNWAKNMEKKNDIKGIIINPIPTDENMKKIKKLAEILNKKGLKLILYGLEVETINYKSYIQFFKELSKIVNEKIQIIIKPASSFYSEKRNIIETTNLLEELSRHTELKLILELNSHEEEDFVNKYQESFYDVSFFLNISNQTDTSLQNLYEYRILDNVEYIYLGRKHDAHSKVYIRWLEENKYIHNIVIAK